ncbi:hypothetical protein LMH66_19155 [Shewanella sp. 10N.7]|uniref:hypothetical protein n=1 Tax=Shewanella sp. 10N.7 TaxID=2885093 RepID=UPI001E5F84C3|nr:hypothetical protein [Shewanella sp. 10N.7]MCC4834765.1 hypothetical protein [Shewanella sp. 10N.7]
MFEKVILRRSENGAALTAGELAEALLFYQNVHIILDFGSLTGLIHQIGMPTLLSLLSRPNISAVYTEDMLTVMPTVINGSQYYSFEAMQIVGNDKVGNLPTQKKRFEHLLMVQGRYDKKQSKRYFERFRGYVPFRKLTDDHYIEGGILSAANMDLLDNEYLKSAVRLGLEDRVGSSATPPDFDFEVYQEGKQFHINTNLNFEKLSHIQSVKAGIKMGFNETNLMLDILNTRNELVFASHFGGEFYTSNLSSRMIDLKCSGLLKRISIEQQNISDFSRVVTAEAPRIKDLINSKAKTFDEFLSLLDRSAKFKSWLVNVNPDQEIVAEYLKAVSSEGWAQSIPSKVLRYVFTGVVGAIEPITGHAFSLADTFLLEKLIGGWKPNRFVEKNLSSFLELTDDI